MLPRATIAKHALFIERLTGPLNDLAPALQRLGYEVRRASDAQAVEALIRSLRRLSLVAVNGDTLRTESARLVATIKNQHPDLPILWFTSDPKTVRTLPKRPDFVSTDLKKLEERITQLVREEFYSPEFVRAILPGIQGVLDEFALPARPAEPCIKSNLTTLHEVNAFLFFSGEGLAGHVVLSSSVGDLSVAYRMQFTRTRFPGHDDLEDLLGEVANQVVGQVKRTLDSDALDCRLGLPHFIRGTGVSFRHKAGAPSLAVEFSNGPQKLQFELCLHRFDGGGIQARSRAGGENSMNPGVLNFL
jgi:CheY-specific phosphatase CheX